MKTSFNSISKIILILLLSNCSKETAKCYTCENFSDGYVIGFDPCTGVLDPNGGDVGFLLRISAVKDTLIVYKFPKGIYQFPSQYFLNYQYNCFFPDSTSQNYAIKIKYRLASNNEKIFPLCRGDIVTGSFNPNNQIIAISISK